MEYTTAEVARNLRLTKDTVWYRKKKLGLKLFKKNKKLYYSEEDIFLISNFLETKRNPNKKISFSDCGNFLIIQSRINYRN